MALHVSAWNDDEYRETSERERMTSPRVCGMDASARRALPRVCRRAWGVSVAHIMRKLVQLESPPLHPPPPTPHHQALARRGCARARVAKSPLATP